MDRGTRDPRRGTIVMAALASLLALAPLACTFESAERAAAQKAAAGPPDGARQKQLLGEMRSIGLASFSWLTDVAGDLDRRPFDEETGETWSVADPRGGEPAVYTVVPHAALAGLLVPSYLAELPEKDPWGHPYQYALNRDLMSTTVVGVRSAGKDGVFEPSPYTGGTFPTAEHEHDVVWADGSFVRWPG